MEDKAVILMNDKTAIPMAMKSTMATLIEGKAIVPMKAVTAISTKGKVKIPMTGTTATVETLKGMATTEDMSAIFIKNVRSCTF